MNGLPFIYFMNDATMLNKIYLTFLTFFKIKVDIFNFLKDRNGTNV